MADSYCDKCGQGAPQNMRICPQCGGRAFSINPPALNKKATDTTGNHRPSPAPISPPYIAPLGAKNIPAEHFPRFIAAMIDSILSQGAVYIVTAVLVQISRPKTASGAFGTTFIAALIIATLYYSLQHSSISQATVGKRLMGLKLITLSGEPVSFGLAVGRALLPSVIFVSGTAIFGAAALPIIMLADQAPQIENGVGGALFLVYIVMIFVPVLLVFGNLERKTLFDMICKTRVIKV